MASTISSTPSLTPADSVSSVSGFHPPASADPDVRRFKHKTYRRVYLERQKRPRTGWWWGYGAEWEETNTDPVKYHWVCAVCSTFHCIGTSSTIHIKEHLTKVHRITDSASVSLPTIPIRDLLALQPQRGNRTPTKAETLEARQKLCRKKLLEWITHDHISFSVVESPYFRAFCESLEPSYEAMICSSHVSVRSWMMTEFAIRQADIVGQLMASQSRIHISFDLWTSPHKNMAVLGVVGHFLTPEYTNQAILLSLRRLEGSHSGENIAELVIETLQKYQIDRLGYFVCDNASSNDTAIRDILKSYGIVGEQNRRRLRCLGHIINLAAQAFLFGKDSEAFESGDLDNLETAYQIWQQSGPVGQIHYLVAFIRASSQRREDFTRLQGDQKALQPLLDNKTRWNSTWTMLRRAQLLRRAINLFCLQYVDSKDLEASVVISDETWELLDQICGILELFHYATEKLQGAAKDGKHGALWECLPMIECLLKEVEDLRAVYPLLDEQSVIPTSSARRSKSSQSVSSLPISQRSSSNEFLAIAINNTWLKLDKYYALTDNSEAYVASVVLNPYEKWTFFEKSWKLKPDWISTAKKRVRGLWEEYKEGASTSIPTQPINASLSRQVKEYGRPDYLAKFRERLYGDEQDNDNSQDEYDRYISPGREKVPEDKQLHPIRWWQSREAEYPILSRLAYDLLSIPAMSAENERLFSSSKDLISDRRNALDIESIEANECIRNWSTIL
jgi:hypothetical protein